MRTQLRTAPFRAWTDAGGADLGSVINHGRSGAVLLDAGDAAYRAHLLKMAALMVERVPAAAGIVFDRTGWTAAVNILADDRRSF